MKRLIRNILTRFIFRFMFDRWWSVKNGTLLECQGDLFIFDDTNGEPGNLKWYFNTNGFWNYIRFKEGSIYVIDEDRFRTVDEYNSQGYSGLEYYKNSINNTTPEQIELYNDAVKRLK